MCSDPPWPHGTLRVVMGDLRCEGPIQGLVHRYSVGAWGVSGIPTQAGHPREPAWGTPRTLHSAGTQQVLNTGLLEQNATSQSHLPIHP